jgi:hypothetical protein
MTKLQGQYMETQQGKAIYYLFQEENEVFFRVLRVFVAKTFCTCSLG